MYRIHIIIQLYSEIIIYLYYSVYNIILIANKCEKEELIKSKKI